MQLPVGGDRPAVSATCRVWCGWRRGVRRPRVSGRRVGGGSDRVSTDKETLSESSRLHYRWPPAWLNTIDAETDESTDSRASERNRTNKIYNLLSGSATHVLPPAHRFPPLILRGANPSRGILRFLFIFTSSSSLATVAATIVSNPLHPLPSYSPQNSLVSIAFPILTGLVHLCSELLSPRPKLDRHRWPP